MSGVDPIVRAEMDRLNAEEGAAAAAFEAARQDYEAGRITAVQLGVSARVKEAARSKAAAYRYKHFSSGSKR